ncbi:hypothetical protein [Roseimaritima ulvae]|uniref:hypothetical protein n=1 Tax=Roseimaritima ulvae TaxID=980254 RepID=UPI0011CE5B6F|nr:hypothetical protein [Roseimaritima ulvae]
MEMRLFANRAHVHTINRRSLAARDATQVFYRSDQSSLVSRFFRERIFNQGVDCFDLAEHFRVRARGRGSNIRAPGGLTADPDSQALLSWASLLER